MVRGNIAHGRKEAGSRPRWWAHFTLGGGGLAVQEAAEQSEIVVPAARQGLKGGTMLLGDVSCWHGSGLRGDDSQVTVLRPLGASPDRRRPQPPAGRCQDQGEFAAMETLDGPVGAATRGKAVWSPFSPPTTGGEVPELGSADAAHRLPGGNRGL